MASKPLQGNIKYSSKTKQYYNVPERTEQETVQETVHNDPVVDTGSRVINGYSNPRYNSNTKEFTRMPVEYTPQVKPYTAKDFLYNLASQKVNNDYSKVNVISRDLVNSVARDADNTIAETTRKYAQGNGNTYQQRQNDLSYDQRITAANSENRKYAEQQKAINDKKYGHIDGDYISNTDTVDENGIKHSSVSSALVRDVAEGYDKGTGNNALLASEQYWKEEPARRETKKQNDVNSIMKYASEYNDAVKDGSAGRFMPDNDTVLNVVGDAEDLNMMTDGERDTLSFVIGKYGQKEANKYLNALRDRLDARITESNYADVQRMAEEHPIAYGVPANTLYGIASGASGLLAEGKSFLTDRKLESSDPLLRSTAMQEAATIGTQNGIKRSLGIEEGSNAAMVSDFLVGTVLSAVNSASTALAMPEAAVLTLFSGNAMGSSLYGASQNNNISQKNAMYNALADGVAESFFEMFSVESLKAFQMSDGNTLRELASNIGKQFATEGSEEIFTEIANILSDVFINGNNSEYGAMYNQLIDNNVDKKTALSSVFKEAFKNIGLAGLAGGISGGISGGAVALNSALNTASDYIDNANRINSNVRNYDGSYNNYYDEMANTIDSSSDEGSRLANIAREYANRLREGGNVSTSENVRFDRNVNDFMRNSMNRETSEKLTSIAEEMAADALNAEQNTADIPSNISPEVPDVTNAQIEESIQQRSEAGNNNQMPTESIVETTDSPVSAKTTAKASSKTNRKTSLKNDRRVAVNALTKILKAEKGTGVDSVTGYIMGEDGKQYVSSKGYGAIIFDTPVESKKEITNKNVENKIRDVMQSARNMKNPVDISYDVLKEAVSNATFENPVSLGDLGYVFRTSDGRTLFKMGTDMSFPAVNANDFLNVLRAIPDGAVYVGGKKQPVYVRGTDAEAFWLPVNFKESDIERVKAISSNGSSKYNRSTTSSNNYDTINVSNNNMMSDIDTSSGGNSNGESERRDLAGTGRNGILSLGEEKRAWRVSEETGTVGEKWGTEKKSADGSAKTLRIGKERKAESVIRSALPGQTVYEFSGETPALAAAMEFDKEVGRSATYFVSENGGVYVNDGGRKALARGKTDLLTGETSVCVNNAKANALQIRGHEYVEDAFRTGKINLDDVMDSIGNDRNHFDVLAAMYAPDNVFDMGDDEYEAAMDAARKELLCDIGGTINQFESDGSDEDLKYLSDVYERISGRIFNILNIKLDRKLSAMKRPLPTVNDHSHDTHYINSQITGNLDNPDLTYSESYSIQLAPDIGNKTRKYNEKHKLVESDMMDAGLATMETMAEYMKPWLDVPGMLPSDIIGKTIFKNGSYGRTGENTTKCVRTLTYEDFKDRIAEKIGRPLTVKESLLVSQKILDIAREPQCIYCYVAADRKAYDEYLGKYHSSMDKYIKALRKGGDYDTLYKEYLDGRTGNDTQKKRFDDWAKIARSGEKYISASDIATRRSRDILKSKNGKFASQVRDAEKYAQSASWAKKVEEYRAYGGDILKFSDKLVSELNSEYGFRMYSFSDFTPAFITENMQMLCDAAAKGLKSLAYTKDTDYAAIFAPTGQAINISCFAKYENGTYVMDSKQGADWESAKYYRDKYKNVGTVMVATNDNMVMWALKQPWIDVVIPYHIVKTGTKIANEYQWKNFTSESSDRNGTKTANILPTEHNNSFKQYDSIVKTRGITPRFSKYYEMVGKEITAYEYMKLVNEVRLPASELSPVTPEFDLNAAYTSFDNFIKKGGYTGSWYNEGVDVNQEVLAVSDDITVGKSPSEVEYGIGKNIENVKAYKKKLSEKNTNAEAFSTSIFDEYDENDIRVHSLPKGTMVNSLRKYVNWNEYYRRIDNSEKYNPLNYKTNDIIYMTMNDGSELTLEMQEYGEFAVIEVLRYENGKQKRYFDKRIEEKRNYRRGNRYSRNTDERSSKSEERASGGSDEINNRKRNGGSNSAIYMGTSRLDINGSENNNESETFSTSLADDTGEYAPAFYSKMERVIDSIKQNKIGAESVESFLKGKGVKDEEIKWSGIRTFLEGKKSVTKQELIDYAEANRLQIEENELSSSGDTRWSEYKIEGGSGYREYLFSIPGSGYINKAMKAHWGNRSGVLAHARVQDFTTSDGNSVMFIEEIQSDWHNAGKKYGYENINDPRTQVEKYDAERSEYVKDKIGKEFGGEESSKFFSDDREIVASIPYNSYMKMINAESRYTDEWYEDNPEKKKALFKYGKKFKGSPDAPFRNNYTDFVLKNMLRKASEGGYEYLAWTTGKMQEDRWSSDYAEGYRIEYDQDIPKFLKKFGKQFGAKLTYVNIGENIEAVKNGNRFDIMNADTGEIYDTLSPLGNYTESEILDIYEEYANDNKRIIVPAIEITPEMIDSVLHNGMEQYSIQKDFSREQISRAANSIRNNETNSGTFNDATAADKSRWQASRVGNTDKTVMPISDIIAKLRHDLGLSITTGNIRGRNVRGQYSRTDKGIRTKIDNNLPTVSHEVGHWFDDHYDIVSNLITAERKEIERGLSAAMKRSYPRNVWMNEGVAEYLRKYFLNSTKTAAEYPEFTKKFKSTLSGQHLAIIESFADDINAYYSLANDDASMFIRNREEGGRDFRTIDEKLRDMGDVFYQGWVDRNHGIKRLDDAMGGHAYVYATNAAYSDAIAGRIITGDLTDAHGKYVAEGLKTALDGVNTRNKEEYRAFGEYLVCLHGPEWLDQGYMVFADPTKNDKDFMDRRADLLRQKYPAFETAGKNVIKFLDNFMQTWAVGNGLVSQEEYDRLRKLYPNYVPFNRAFVKGSKGARRGFASQNSPVKRAKGSGLDIINPVDNIFDTIIGVVNAAVRNNVMLEIRKSALTNGDANFMTLIPEPLSPKAFDMTGLKKSLAKQVNESGISLNDTVIVDNIIEGLSDVMLQFERGRLKDNQVTVLVGGVKETWQINDPLLLQSVTNLGVNDIPKFLHWYGNITRFMTGMITGNNVVWSITSNSVRDLGTALVYSKEKNKVKVLADIAKGYFATFRENSKNIDPLLYEYLAIGGGDVNAYSADINMAKKARKQMTESNAAKILGKLNPFDKMMFIANCIEKSPRFATYKVCRESGMNEQRAFYEAMDITVNFRRGGMNSRMANNVFPFFNAGVQGTDKAFRFFTAKDIPADKKVSAALGRILSFIAGSAMIGALEWLFNNQDDDSKKNYKGLSTYTKNNFFVIPKSDGKYIAIPKPRELGIVTSLTADSLEKFVGGNSHAFDEFYEYVIGASLPSAVSDLLELPTNIMKDGTAKGLGNTFINVAGDAGIVGTGVHMVANKDFLGRDIVSRSLDGKDPRLQYDRRTTVLAYQIGQLTGLSPKMLDYFFENTTGIAQKLSKALFPVGEENRDITLGVANQWVKDPLYSTDIANWMYDRASETSEKASSYDTWENKLEAKLDSNMTGFYGRYASLSKNDPDTQEKRMIRGAVLDMIYDYQSAIESGYRSDLEKSVYDLQDTSILPSVMQTSVKVNGTSHDLSASDYYDYQTKYNALYWDYVGNNIGKGKGNDGKIKIVKEAKELAKDRADQYIARKAGFGKIDDKYGNVRDDYIIRFEANVDRNGDKKISSQEIRDTALELMKQGARSNEAYSLYSSKRPEDKHADQWNDGGYDFRDFLVGKNNIDDIKDAYTGSDNKDERAIRISESIKSMGLSEEAQKILWETAGYSTSKKSYGKYF